MFYSLPLEVIGNNRPWVAEILGFHPEYMFDRRFLRPHSDYSRANGAGTRGITRYYLLDEGPIYEVQEYQSWRSQDRYYCFVEGRSLNRLSLEEVWQWLTKSAISASMFCQQRRSG